MGLMSEFVKLSIIIPAYNVEEYIGACIDSILSQSYENYEVIVIDDGSSDRTVEIVREYSKKDTRVKLLQQKNSGPSRARNTGIECASGDYILFMDSDDMYKTSDALGIIGGKCKDVDVVAYGWEEFDETRLLDTMLEFPKATCEAEDYLKGDYSEKKYSGVEYLEKSLEYKHQYAWYCWRYAFKTAFWKEHGFEFKEGYKYEDVSLVPWVILKAKTIVCVREILYRYRINRTGAITMDRSAKTDLDYLDVITQNVKRACEFKGDLSERLIELLCNNFSDMYYTVLILCAQYRKKIGYDKVLAKLKDCVWITGYTIDVKQKLVRGMVKCVGLDKTIWALGIRKKVRHGKRK